MKDSSTILISILAATAIILVVLLFGSINTADAANSASKTINGDYIIITGGVTDSSSLVYIIHVPSKKMVVYVADRTSNRFQLVDAKRMDQLF